MSTFTAGLKVRTVFQIAEADLIANVTQDQLAMDGGALTGFAVVVQKTITTGGTLKLQTPTGAAGAMQDVPGSTITVPNGAVKGTVFSMAIPQGPDATKAPTNTRVSIVPTGFATAGAISGHFTVGSQSNPAGV